MSVVVPFYFKNKEKRVMDLSLPEVFFKSVSSDGKYFELKADVLNSIYVYFKNHRFYVRNCAIYNKVGYLCSFDSFESFGKNLSFRVIEKSKYFIDAADNNKTVEFDVINMSQRPDVGSAVVGSFEKSKGVVFNIYRTNKNSMLSESVYKKMFINPYSYYLKSLTKEFGENIAGLLVMIRYASYFDSETDALVSGKLFESSGLENVFTFNKLNDANASLTELNNKLSGLKFESGYRYYVESNFMLEAVANNSKITDIGSDKLSRLEGLPAFRVNYE